MTSALVSPGMTTMSMPTEQTAVMASSFSSVRAAAVGGVDHAVILRHGDERAGQAADVVGRHDAALLDRVVQQGQGRPSCHAAAAALKAHLLQNVRNASRQSPGVGASDRSMMPTGTPRRSLARFATSWPMRVILNAVRLDQLGHLVHRGVLRQLGQRGAHRHRGRRRRRGSHSPARPRRGTRPP